MILTQERLKQLLIYDPDTGKFCWRVDRGPIGKVRAGDVAGGLHHSGYWHVFVAGKKYGAHRLAWLYMMGEWPSGEVDHANRDKGDNRWSNLRDASRTQNLVNRPDRDRPKHNLPRGVKPAYGGRYGAWINSNKQRRLLGVFDTPEEAQAVYISASRLTFGKFSPFQ